MYVVLCGNPVDGIQVHGPFGSSEGAHDWAERGLKNETWWVTDLHEASYPAFYLVGEYHEMAEKPDIVGPFETHGEAEAYAETRSVETEIYICERVQ